MAVMGSQLSGGTGNWVHINEDQANQRAIWLPSFVFPTNAYIWRMGGFVRRSNQSNSGKQPKIWWAAWLMEDGAPVTLLGYTYRLPVGNSGNDISGPFAWVNPAYSNANGRAIRVPAGAAVAYGFKVEQENVELARTGPNTPHYRREFHPQNVPPTNPFDQASAGYENQFGIYAEWFENTKPTAVLSQPADGGLVNPQATVFQGQMVDAQGVLPALDSMSQYQLEVRRDVDDVLMWFGTFAADAQESGSNVFLRAYQGLVSLEPGLTYSWRGMVADAHGTWSEWSGWRHFGVNALGQVTATDQNPSTKIDSDSAAITWGGRWSHPTTNTAADRVRVRVLRAADLSVIKQSPDITKAVAWTTASPPGTAFTVTAAEAKIGALPGGAYAYQIQARSAAVDHQWSPWSAPRFFSINRLPTIPTNLQPPTGNYTSANTFTLEWNVDDPDEDDVYGVSDFSEVRLTRPNGSVVTLDNIYTYDADEGKGSVVLTPTQINQEGVYKWQVRAKENLATTPASVGASDWSTIATFEYRAGPVVTINSPTDEQVVTSVRPTINFSVASGTFTSFEARLYDVDQAAPKVSSGAVQTAAAAAADYTLPAGWVRNDSAYDLEVTVWSGSSKGVSTRREFTVEFAPAPSLVSLEVSALTDLDDPQEPRMQTSVALLSWGMTELNPGEFGGYNVYRRLASQEDWTLLRTLSSPGQNKWRDYWGPPNELLVYGVSQIQRIGLTEATIDEVESEILEAQVELDMFVPVLNSVYDPYLRMALMWLDDDLDGSTDRPKASYVTWGSNNKATTVTTPAEYDTRKVNFGITLRADPRGYSLRDNVQRWVNLVKSGHPVCYRPQWSEEMMYAEIESWSWSRGDPGTREIRGTLKEIDFTPGAEGGS